MSPRYVHIEAGWRGLTQKSDESMIFIMAKRRVTITIDEDLASRLDEVAEGMDGKFSKAVEHAVREFFDLEKLRGGEQGFVWIDFGNDDDGRWAFRGNEPEMMLQLGPVLMRAFFSSVETAWEEDDAED